VKDEAVLDAFASEMLTVFGEHKLVRTISEPIDSISIDEAYDVQDRVIERRVASGERVAGYKVGCTSPAIRKQFNLDQPIAGRVMDPHVLRSGDAIDIVTYVRCAVEPEFVVHIGTGIADPDISDPDLRASIAGISAGIEVHEYTFFHGSPTSQELIASNGIHTHLVVSNDVRRLDGVDLAAEAIEIWVNNELAAAGRGADVMGDPLRSVRWLVRHLAARGQTLASGDVVIPGSATPLITVVAGDQAESRFGSFGSCSVRFA
jgi:2-keto-4-pentenoate hydratase